MIAKRLAFATLLFACTALALDARQAQAPATSGALVHLDVSVHDSAGRPVAGLTSADFEILQAGRPVPLVSVAAVALQPPGPAAMVRGLLSPGQVAHDVRRNDDAVDRTVAIVLDDMDTGGRGAGPDSWMSTTGLDLARAFVDQLGPDDRGTISFTFMGRQQGLTSDRARLRAAIDGFSFRQVRPADCAARGSADGCIVDTLRHVAESLPASPPRRKVVLVISENSGLPSVELPADGAQPASDLQRTLRALHATNASVYSITPAGVAAAAPSVVGTGVSLTTATGGLALVDSAAQASTAPVLDAMSAYYILSLRAAQPSGGFGGATVRVRRPGVEVRAASGYFAPDGATPPAGAGAMTLLESAIVAPHAQSDLPMGTTVAVFGVPGRRDAVVSVTTAVTSSTALGATAWQAEVAATAFDPQWRPRASHRQTIEVTTPPGAAAQAVDVISGLELLPGRYELRVAAQSGESAGSVFVDVEIPEFQIAPLSASGLVVSTDPTPYVTSPLLAQTLPVTPTTRRMFLRHESADVFLRFYQGGRGRMRNLPVSLRIADAAGEGVIQGSEVIAPSQFGEGRSTDWRFSLPLDRLTPGEYLLTVEAALDDRRESRYLRFVVAQ